MVRGTRIPDSGFGQPKALLGVGSLIGECFSIFFRRFILIVTIAFVPILLSNIISGLLIGFEVAINLKAPDLPNAGKTMAYVFSFILILAVDAFIAALLVQLAYDKKFRQTIALKRYFDQAKSVVLPLVILSIAKNFLAIAMISVTIIEIYLGTIEFYLLLIPQIWLNTVFCVLVPTIVIDRTGFGSLYRSAALTRGYRWPILGLVILATMFTLPANIGTRYLTGIAVNLEGITSGIILSSALYAIITGLDCILVALTYARLQEIKEGVSLGQIASVFD
ncbi:hypothetical protein [uncultured Roseibium sp.]|uniref:hypothetical protein n=1 Tax=uncultured Roseibium sp. TaxID=1936171 RepID=UPI003216632D